MEQFKVVVNELRGMYEPYQEGLKRWERTMEEETQNLVLPPWLCQPYVRDTPENHIKKVEEKQIETGEKMNSDKKRNYEDADGNPISRKRMKKLRRISRRPEKPSNVSERSLERCQECENPLGSKCLYRLCKKCCRDKCYVEELDCEGHRILVKTRREKAKSYASQRRAEKAVEVL